MELTGEILRSIIANALSPFDRAASGNYHQQVFYAQPEWATLLERYIRKLFSISGSGRSLDTCKRASEIINSDEPFPFEEILLPLAEIARDELIRRNQYYRIYTTPKCRITLERNLLRALFIVSAPTLQSEFLIYRSTKLTTYEKMASRHSGADQVYKQFISEFSAGGMLSFFAEYPVLARLMSLRAMHWVNSLDEFFLRFWSDNKQIKDKFNFGLEIGKMEEMEVSISDYHDGGRSVTIISFGGGFKLVYKPRDSAIESEYNNLLTWLNEHKTPLELKTFSILNYGTHSWSEYVKKVLPEDEGEMKKYYRNAGALLCVTYMLNATDLHYENVIPSGDNPVLVDVETLLHPYFCREQEIENQANDPVIRKLYQSVIGTSLLPRWQAKGRELFDPSGFGNLRTENEHHNAMWRQINTNSMSFGLNAEPDPYRTDFAAEIADHSNEIIEGFSLTYRFIMEKRDLLLEPGGPIEQLANKKVRFVFRGTQSYISMQYRLLAPKFMRDATNRSSQIDMLELQESPLRPAYYPILIEESLALENLDIPKFNANTSSRHLALSNGRSIENCFEVTSYEACRNKLRSFDEEDLQLQVNLIKGSVYSRTSSSMHGVSFFDAEAFRSTEGRCITNEELVNEAKALAKVIMQNVIPLENGAITWIALQYVPDNKCMQVLPVGYSFFDGATGIALFFAALAHITDCDEFKDLSIRSLLPFTSWVMNTQLAEKSVSLGGALGLCSLLYPLVSISKFIREPRFLEYARQISSLISEDLICADTKYDVISGSAGAILGLLKLYEQCKDPGILKSAECCGAHLLQSMKSTASGNKAWMNDDGQFCTGFAHGAAGISFSLLRLYEVTHRDDFLKAASEGILYEQSSYDFKKAAWQVPGTEIVEKAGCFWCGGPPGIGLARLAGLDILDTPDIRSDIEKALQSTLDFGLTNLDHLCCGNLGRLDFLFAAGLKLRNPDLQNTVYQSIAKVVDNSKATGGYNYGRILSFVPGFFQGASGIGYEFLRLAFPEKIPSALTWE